MIVYWGLFLIFAVGSLTWKGDNRESKVTIPFILAMALATLVVGLRWEVGPDWNAYFRIYEYGARLSLGQALQRSDPGFYALIWALNYYDAPFWALNLACAAIFLFGLARFCATMRNPWLAMCVAVPYLVIIVGMNLMRQAAALGFVFLALRHLSVKPLWRSMGWVLIGSMFHASAIVAAFFIAISHVRNRFYATLLVAVSAFPVYYVLSATLDEYLTRYQHSIIDSKGVYFRLVMNAVPAIIFLVLRRKFQLPPDEDRFWRNISILSLAVLPIPFFVQSTTSVDRASLYALPLQLLVFSAYPALAAGTSSRLGTTAIIVIYSAISMVVYFSFGVHARYFIPYHMAEIW